MALVLAGSCAIPSLVARCPKYVMELIPNSHLDNFSFMLAPINRSNTYCNASKCSFQDGENTMMSSKYG